MNMRTNLLAALLALLLGCGVMQSAQAQRPTRIYGSAWQAPQYSPYCTVYLSDDQGHKWTAQTNWRSDWWLDNMPSNRWYTLRALGNFLGTYSPSIRVYVPEQGIFQLNKVKVPNLICH